MVLLNYYDKTKTKLIGVFYQKIQAYLLNVDMNLNNFIFYLYFAIFQLNNIVQFIVASPQFRAKREII